MALDDEQSKRAEQDADKTRRKRECNWQRGMSIVSGVFFGIAVAFLIVLVGSCLHVPHFDCVIGWLVGVTRFFTTEKLPAFQNIYLSLFVGFIAAYFTVLSILLARKPKLGFGTCLKYMCEWNRLGWHVLILLLHFILIEFFFPVFRCSPLVVLYAVVAILQFLWCFCIGVVDIAYLEDTKMAIALLKKYVRKIKGKNKEKNKDKFFDCFYDFISKCYRKDKFEIYVGAFNFENNKTDSELFLELTRELFNTSEASADDYESLIAVLIKELNKLLTVNHKVSDVDFDMVKACYDLVYSLMSQAHALKKLKRPSFSKAVEPLSFFIDTLIREDVPKGLEDVVNSVIEQWRCIIIKSLGNYDFDAVKQEIETFSGKDLVLEVHGFPKYIVNKYNRFVVDIITWIFNLLQFKGFDKDYFDYIQDILISLEFSYIVIFDVDSEMYDMDIDHVTARKFVYTRNYYIAMLLLYCEATKRYNAQNLVGQLKYFDTNQKNGQEYKNVLGGLKNITEKAFDEIMPDYRAEFESAEENVENMLSSIIKEIDERYMNDMRADADYEKVQTAMSKRKQEILAEFDSLADKTADYEQLRPIRTQIEVSWREIVNDSSLHVFKADYYPLFFRILFDRYVNSSQLSVKDVSSLAALPCDDGATLIMPNALFRSLDSVTGVQFTGSDSIRYEQKNFNIERVHTDSDFVVLKSDFNKAFAKPEINDVASMIDERKMISDISFSTYVYLIFSQNMAMDFPAYRIKGWKNNLSSKDNEVKN